MEFSKTNLYNYLNNKNVIQFSEFEEAQTRISPFVSPSILRYSDWLSDILNAEIYLKLECLQPGRSFKIRGATNTLLSEENLPLEVITASGGNHGLGVAIAAKNLNISCKVVLPTTTSQYRVSLLKLLGAKVQLRGKSWDDANNYARRLSNSEESLYIHPFADYSVIVGQGTIALELRDQIGDFDALVASVGGGGLLTGISLAFESMDNNHKPEYFAVETIGADSLAQSLQAKKLIELSSITSIAKTLGARKTTPFIFDSLQRMVREAFVIEDKHAVESMISFLNHEKLLIEPATSCIIAATLLNPEYFQNKKCVLIICGGNVTYDELLGWQDQFSIEL